MHRNVANVVVHTDLNCLSVLQYAVDVLRVQHVIVCGHYGCGGVRAALSREPLGLIDNWLRHIRDVYDGAPRRARRRSPIRRRGRTGCASSTWPRRWPTSATRPSCRTPGARGQPLTVHGWIYELGDGLLRDLDLTVERADQIPQAYRMT